jgi:hypothetical protein
MGEAKGSFGVAVIRDIAEEQQVGRLQFYFIQQQILCQGL